MIVHTLAGARAETGSRGRGNEVTQADGLSGLKALGVRDLNYRLAFLACNVKACNKKVGFGLCVVKCIGIDFRACFNKAAFVLVRVSIRQHGYLCVFQYGGIDTRADDELTAEKVKVQMGDTHWQKVYDMSRDKNLYANMCQSLFPTIHGNDEVKRGILLMLLGGVAKETGEGTHLRGDINVCIVGDPSTAKSNFLK